MSAFDTQRRHSVVFTVFLSALSFPKRRGLGTAVFDLYRPNGSAHPVVFEGYANGLVPPSSPIGSALMNLPAAGS